MSSNKHIIIARCPKVIGQENIQAFSQIIKQQLPPNEYIVFIDANSDIFDIELVTKPIVINSSDDLDKELEKLSNLVKEIRDGDLKPQ